MTDIITTADKLACAKRELAMRKNAYPRAVEQNKMSAGKAAHELAAMEAIVQDYEEKPDCHAEIERLTQALHEIERWSHAYPLTAFPEPDLVKSRVLLEAGGITLDAVSASAMRHVVVEVGRMASRALRWAHEDAPEETVP